MIYSVGYLKHRRLKFTFCVGLQNSDALKQLFVSVHKIPTQQSSLGCRFTNHRHSRVGFQHRLFKMTTQQIFKFIFLFNRNRSLKLILKKLRIKTTTNHDQYTEYRVSTALIHDSFTESASFTNFTQSHKLRCVSSRQAIRWLRWVYLIRWLLFQTTAGYQFVGLCCLNRCFVGLQSGNWPAVSIEGLGQLESSIARRVYSQEEARHSARGDWVCFFF